MRRILVILILTMFSVPFWAQNNIVVSKKEFKLYVVAPKGDTLFTAPVAYSAVDGPKEFDGDEKTPEGTFPIYSIEDSSKWDFDFGDGKGKVVGAYGPLFIRIRLPYSLHIGIHGTIKPETIGTKSTHGCIRMYNEDILKMRKLITYRSKVTILPET